MKIHGYVECCGCGSNKAYLRYVPKYHGLRGHCSNCGTNWPES